MINGAYRAMELLEDIPAWTQLASQSWEALEGAL
jgi:hypothetical protein